MVQEKTVDETDLTARAREIAAELSEHSREQLDRMVSYLRRNGGELAPLAQEPQALLVFECIVRSSGIGGVRGWGRVTALGRAVAAVLAETDGAK